MRIVCMLCFIPLPFHQIDIRSELVNPPETNKFGKAEIVNEHMHSQISHHMVDEHYINDICVIFFETRIDHGNMVNVMLGE